jgi:two-component system, OmpR family, phosphate regulon sensor histidine kinase PhoR
MPPSYCAFTAQVVKSWYGNPSGWEANPLRKRLFINTLIIATVVLAVFGLIGAFAADLWYTRLMVNELKKDTAIIENRITSSPSMPEIASEASKELSSGGNDVRVTIVAFDGTVLGDSSADWKTMENHSGRPEIAAAFKDGWGSSQRYSATLKARLLYVAVYDKNNRLYVRTAMPMYEIQKIYWVFAGFAAVSLVISLAVAAILANRASRLLSQPIVALAKMTGEIANGNYEIHAPAYSDPEFVKLSNGLIELSKSLNVHVSALESSNTQLTTVLSSISEGLIAMDGGGGLLFINHAACAMLELEHPETLIGEKVQSIIPIKPIGELAHECLGEGKTVSAEVTLPAGIQLRASASPMRAPASGCILLLMDVTQLRKLENMRRDFVANVTHELRTPLTSIRGYVETLQSGALADPKLSAKFLEIIEIESERLSNLINDLLYLSEIESSSQDTGIRRFRLADTAEAVVEMLEFAASSHGVKLDCGIGGDVYLEANPDRIKQLLLNLADNAIKYNHEGGSVLLSAEKTHGLVRISVKDTGIGISEEHVSRIFERFYRVDRGRSRSMGGTGLGLSIVKHIVDLYRGNIRLISEAGRGSEFIIELPLKYEAKKKG